VAGLLGGAVLVVRRRAPQMQPLETKIESRSAQ
jgi:hypothetical protein